MAQMPPGMLQTLLARMATPTSGAALQRAMAPRAPQPPAPPQAPVAPAMPVAPLDPAVSQMAQSAETLRNAVQQAQSRVDASQQALAQYQPPLGETPQYQAPQYQPQQIAQPNKGFEIGTLLGALLGGYGGGVSGANALAYDTQEREKDYARRAQQEKERFAAAEETARTQYEQQNAEANRRVQLGEMTLRQLESRATADENSLDRLISTQERGDYHMRYANILDDRAQTYQQSVNNRFFVDQKRLDLNWAQLRHRAENDAEVNGIRKNGQILQYEAGVLRAQTQLQTTGMRIDGAWNVAMSRLHGQIMLERLRQDSLNGRAVMHEKNAMYRSNLGNQLKVLEAAITRGSLPGASAADHKAAEDAANQVNGLLTQIQADSGGTYSVPQTQWDKDWDTLKNEAAQAANQNPYGAPYGGAGGGAPVVVQNIIPQGGMPYGVGAPTGGEGSLPWGAHTGPIPGMRDWMNGYGAGAAPAAPHPAQPTHATPPAPPTAAPRWAALDHGKRQAAIDRMTSVFAQLAHGPVTINGHTITSPQQAIAEFEQAFGVPWASVIQHDRPMNAPTRAAATGGSQATPGPQVDIPPMGGL